LEDFKIGDVIKGKYEVVDDRGDPEESDRGS